MNKLPHAPWFEVYYRSKTREGHYSCRTCGSRAAGLHNHETDILAATLLHVQRCNPTAVTGLATIDGEQRPCAIMNGQLVLPAPAETPFGKAYDRVRPPLGIVAR